MKSRSGTTCILSALIIFAMLPLIGMSGCQTQSAKKGSVPDAALAPQPERFKAGDLEVIVARPLPDTLPTPKLLVVQEERISTDTALALFGFDKRLMRERQEPELGGYQYAMAASLSGRKYNESITIKPDNHIVYQRNHKVRYTRRDRHLNKERAKRLAKDFIESHGGMPKDAMLIRIEPAARDRIKHDNGVEEIVHQYEVVYVNRDYEGYPIRGANRISVLVDDEGVIRYDRFWRTPRKMVGRPQKLADPKTAVREVLTHIASHQALYSADMFFGSGVVNIYNVELVYFSPEPKNRVKYLRPAYRVRFIGNGTVAYADAITGKAINIALSDPTVSVNSWLDEDLKAAEKRVYEYIRKYKIAPDLTEPPVTVRYVWAGGTATGLPKELPIYLRESKALSDEDVRRFAALFGTPERLPMKDTNFYKFGSARQNELKPGEDYTFQTSKQDVSFTYELVEWMRWPDKHQQLPDKEAAMDAAIAFLKPRGLLPKEVGEVEISVQRAEYVQPTKELVTAPAVWVHFQGKVDGYPSVGPDGRPDVYSWVTVSIGSGGKVLNAHGMLPEQPKRIVKPLRSVKDALAEMNRSNVTSNADDPIRTGSAFGGWFMVGPDLKRIKPKVNEYKVTSVEVAYQVRISKKNEWYLGPVYVFTLAGTDGARPEKITAPAARP